jgi:hypothetical protein
VEYPVLPYFALSPSITAAVGIAVSFMEWAYLVLCDVDGTAEEALEKR